MNGPSNTIPFGYGPNFYPVAFVYKNMLAFSLSAGDKICFDTGVINDNDIVMDIDICHTATNGGTTCDASGYTRLAEDTMPSPNARGDSSCGTWDLCFTVGTSYSFPAGGMTVKMTPQGSYLNDNTYNENLCWAYSSDSSGRFVQRWWAGGSYQGINFIGGVRFCN